MRTAEELHRLADQPKVPRTPAAGPYGHPFHPILVTVPIGAWLGSLVLDIGSRITDPPDGMSRSATWMIGLGILGAAVAALIGLLDLSTIPRHTRAFLTSLAHAGINVVVLTLFIVSWSTRRGADVTERTSLGLIALSIVALGALSISGWLGGMLSYRFGVRVAREQDQAAGYQA